MSFLKESEKQYFEEFWTWTTKNSWRAKDIKELAYEILFNSYYSNDSRKSCGSYCGNCIMYEKNRCINMVDTNSYKTRESSENKQISACDYYYYEHRIKHLRENFDSLCLYLGTYRVKQFEESLYNKAKDSISLHNKLNPNHKKDEMAEKDLVYFSSEDLVAMDMWLKFKNENYEGSFLCSLLSDF